MGTYLTVVLKDKTEEHIKQVNQILEMRGFETEIHEGVKYGAFTTQEQLEEDVRFMNEEPEGLKQAPGMERPITAKDLGQIFWMKIGHCVFKLSGGEPPAEALIVANWAKDHKPLINTKESTNYGIAKVKSYIS